MLKVTKVELAKISDANMHLFIQKEMRGGISYVNKRYSKANNKYCSDYDKNKPKNFIFYLDTNNLYGDAMSQYLPHGRSEWVKINNELISRILNKSDNSLHGYFLEVDLDYQKYLHDYHQNYSLGPEKIKIEYDMLSPYF